VKLRVEINLDNDAFIQHPGYEVYRVLDQVSNNVHDADTLDIGDGASLFDSNGNTVGFWRVAE